MVAIEAWKEAIVRCGYPLVFLTAFDPLSQPGCVDCSYDGQKTEIEYYFDESPEIPAPPSLANTHRVVAQFCVRTRYGESARCAAVAAAASLCIATGGVIEDDGSHFSARRAAGWARGILNADEELAKKALAFPHPDSVEDSEQAFRPVKPWWRFW
jgi:hypothetical protein